MIRKPGIFSLHLSRSSRPVRSGHERVVHNLGPNRGGSLNVLFELSVLGVLTLWNVVASCRYVGTARFDTHHLRLLVEHCQRALGVELEEALPTVLLCRDGFAQPFGLPKKVVAECVQGFKEAVKKYSDASLRPTSLPFADWSLRTFGRGIHKHFMKPYNEKLWQVNLREMTAEWCGMFVPQPMSG